MQHIKRRKVQKYAFDNRDKPCLNVKPGETFRIETDDALSGMIADDSDKPKVEGFAGKHFANLAKTTPGLFNPVVGPIYVGYGITDTGEGAAYLFLGRLF